jgi:hypothetical protein
MMLPSPLKSPTCFPKIPHSSHSFKTLTPKHTRRSSTTKHEYSIADLFIRKHRNLHLEPCIERSYTKSNTDVEKGLGDGEEDMKNERREREGRLVYIAIAVFATLGIGAWGVSLSIAMGVLVM